MIIFHEGLPRSGKSYEAVVKQIIPALLKRRQVFAYIEGLNHQKFAEVTGIPLDEMTGKTQLVKIDPSEFSALANDEKSLVLKNADGWYRPTFTGLLHQIELEQVKTISKHVANDSLVVIDEAQDHWPVGVKSLDADITKFVTQHGHRGIDIIIMGQDNRDCHALWKRRIDQLFVFVKQDAIGRPTKYTWSSFKQNKGKFIKLNSGTGEYEEKYFGLYKSHTDGTLNKETKQDDRSNIFKSAIFRYYLPAFLVVLVVAMVYIYRFFSGGGLVKAEQLPSVSAVQTKPVANPPPKPSPPEKPKEPEKPKSTYSHAQYIEEVITETKPRLGAIIEGKDKNGGRVITALVQFLDKSNRVIEEFTLPQLEAFGWGYLRTAYGLKLIKGNRDIAVTAWPLNMDRVPQNINEGINAQARAANSPRS
ncbi:MAG: Zonular occludens toxin [Methylomonas sp.]|nr:Zonular occludens toxin [Methylomonas sp.]